MTASRIKIRKICEWCGLEYYANKTNSRFCSRGCNDKAYKHRLRLENVRKAEDNVASQVHKNIEESIKDKEYLSPNESAAYLGISVKTVYKLVYKKKLPAYRLSARCTRIKKSDITSLIDGSTYYKINRHPQQPITEFYTTKEVLEKFGIGQNTLYKIAKEKSLPKVVQKGYTYWSKSHIDKHLSRFITTPGFDESYTVEEIMGKYSMTRTAVYSFVSKHGIPKKKKGNIVYYSKLDFDRMKISSDPSTNKFITVKEAMEIFNLSKNQVMDFVRYHAKEKVHEGKYVKFQRMELENYLKPPIIEK